MEAYIYQVALLCTDCAVITMNEFELFNMLGGSSSPFRRPKPWTDSDAYPQGPYPAGGGEADSPQHCDACGVFLENPLTGDGSRYVNEHLIEHARDGSGERRNPANAHGSPYLAKSSGCRRCSGFPSESPGSPSRAGPFLNRA